jgi:hypothetical protein
MQDRLNVKARSVNPLLWAAAWMALMAASVLPAQTSSTSQVAQASAGPIAIVPLDNRNSDAAPTVTGALEVTAGRAVIAVSGSVKAGTATVQVILPRRGTLRICASTTVKLAADSSVPEGESPGLLMAMDHGAIEASFATGRNADILLTPDFRILIGGQGAADVKVRLGEHGDTCVDNAGVHAPYVLVSSVFDGGAYRVQSGQRVMFQHGNLHEVVDHEKESCGCPPSTAPQGNEFPLAQSEGLAPLPTPAPAAPTSAQTAPPLTYNSAERTPQPAAIAPATGAAANSAIPKPAQKPGFFSKIGRFFRSIFGAE